MERLRRAKEEEGRRVEALYSVEPKRIVLGDREFRISRNYFDPKGRNAPDTFVAKDNGFGFTLFLPDYGGFTKENWREGWSHPDRIDVVQVRRIATHTLTDGTQRRYGDPIAGYGRLRRLFEEAPAFKLYGLEGYRRGGGGATQGVLWTGTRSNGEFFFFESSLGPGEQPARGRRAFCKVRYSSEKEDLYVAYRYSQHHLAKWREIDDAIWHKLHAWRIK